MFAKIKSFFEAIWLSITEFFYDVEIMPILNRTAIVSIPMIATILSTVYFFMPAYLIPEVVAYVIASSLISTLFVELLFEFRIWLEAI